MSTLHTKEVADGIKRRLQQLRPDSPRKWGRMSADQMLWHVNLAMELALGRFSFSARPPLPRVLLRWMILNLPWPRGAQTPPPFRAGEQRYDFEQERVRCAALIDELASRSLEGAWPVHSLMGQMNGTEWSRLQAKHLDHHLRQFGC
jgi:hypothetical protein